jgi:hypothetical protein
MTRCNRFTRTVGAETPGGLFFAYERRICIRENGTQRRCGPVRIYGIFLDTENGGMM